MAAQSRWIHSRASSPKSGSSFRALLRPSERPMSAIGPKRTSLVAPHMSAFGCKADMPAASNPWRLHPADALLCCLLLTVVRSKISPSPSAHRTPASAFNIAQDLIGSKATYRQRPVMMAGPIALALAVAINEQLANAMGAD